MFTEDFVRETVFNRFKHNPVDEIKEFRFSALNKW